MGAVAAACVALAACGSSEEELPAETARQMLIELRDARDEFDADNCDRASEAVAALNGRIDGLSNKVDGELRNALSEGSSNLARLIAESPTCLGTDPIEPPPPTTDPTTTDTTTDTTTTTDPTTTDTTTTDTTTDTTTTETTTPPPDDGDTGGTGGAGQ